MIPLPRIPFRFPNVSEYRFLRLTIGQDSGGLRENVGLRRAPAGLQHPRKTSPASEMRISARTCSPSSRRRTTSPVSHPKAWAASPRCPARPPARRRPIERPDHRPGVIPDRANGPASHNSRPGHWPSRPWSLTQWLGPPGQCRCDSLTGPPAQRRRSRPGLRPGIAATSGQAADPAPPRFHGR